MNHDIQKSFATVQNAVKAASSISEGMTQLLVYCQKNTSSRVWNSIGQLDFEQDSNHLGVWLNKLLTSVPPSDNIKAFWFGLFNQPLDDGGDVCTLYVIGSTEFDPNDETGDWACITKKSYVPEGRYANSKVLSEISQLVAQNSQTKDVGEYVLCFGYACLAVKEIRRGNRLLTSKAVAVGFDEGDFVIL